MRFATKIATAAATVGLGLAALAAPGHAAPVINFGQTSNANTITATAAGGTTTISGSNINVGVTQFLGGGAPFNAQLSLTGVTSTGAATVNAGVASQAFSGSFSITSGGTNYLSGSFANALVSGAVGGTALTLDVAQPPNTLSFTSSVLSAAQLGTPRGFSLSFTNVTPIVAVSGGTLASFASTVAGNASAETTAVPEPATLALLGAGLVGLGVARRGRRKQTVAA